MFSITHLLVGPLGKAARFESIWVESGTYFKSLWSSDRCLRCWAILQHTHIGFPTLNRTIKCLSHFDQTIGFRSQAYKVLPVMVGSSIASNSARIAFLPQSVRIKENTACIMRFTFHWIGIRRKLAFQLDHAVPPVSGRFFAALLNPINM